MLSWRLHVSTCTPTCLVTLPLYVCRVQDYWEGYKLFCYAFYSHSAQHEIEFRQSKLGSSIFFIDSRNGIQCMMFSSMQSTFATMCQCEFLVLCNGFVSPGQLVCRRHVRLAPPSRRAIHDSCTQLLPLIEMYCKWVLQEDCSDLHSLMLRFESEAKLQTHEPGRSLLMMLRDDEPPLQGLPRQTAVDTPANLFDVFRNRLAAADLAIRELHSQVHILSPT